MFTIVFKSENDAIDDMTNTELGLAIIKRYLILVPPTNRVEIFMRLNNIKTLELNSN